MSKATEEILGKLHGKLAAAMLAALDPIQVRDELNEIIDTIPCTNPSLFTAVAKFLKDNEVTMMIEGNEALTALAERTAAARAKRKLPEANVVDISAGLQARGK